MPDYRDDARGWPGRTFAAMLAGDIALTLAYLAATLAGLAGSRAFKLVDLNEEANLPAWYASSKLLLIGLVLLALAVRPLARDARLRPFARTSAVLAGVFVFLSADEAGRIHERITGLLGRLPFVPSLGGNGVWMFVYAALGLAALVAARRPLKALAETWPREMALAVAGIALMGAGGIILEGISYLWEPGAALYPLEVAAEEFLEMAGASVVLYAVMRPFALAVSALAGGVSASVPEESPRPRRASGTG